MSKLQQFYYLNIFSKDIISTILKRESISTIISNKRLKISHHHIKVLIVNLRILKV
jgi:hypothetical protein